MGERLMASVSMSPSRVTTISSNVQRVTVRPSSCGNWLATAMIGTRVREETGRGRPERGHLVGPQSRVRGTAVATGQRCGWSS